MHDYHSLWPIFLYKRKLWWLKENNNVTSDNNDKMSEDNNRINDNHEVTINVKVGSNSEVCKVNVNINYQINIKMDEVFVCNILIT